MAEVLLLNLEYVFEYVFNLYSVFTYMAARPRGFIEHIA